MDHVGFLKGIKAQIEFAIAQAEAASVSTVNGAGQTAEAPIKRKRRMSAEAKAAAGLRLETWRAKNAGQTLEQYRKSRQAAKDALAKSGQATPVAATAAK